MWLWCWPSGTKNGVPRRAGRIKRNQGPDAGSEADGGRWHEARQWLVSRSCEEGTSSRFPLDTSSPPLPRRPRSSASPRGRRSPVGRGDNRSRLEGGPAVANVGYTYRAALVSTRRLPLPRLPGWDEG